jgi:DHA1 family tetracycline resistance protein-like MFS transporter
MSVYMLALGMRDSQIGLLTSISTLLQVFWTLMSGAITDKMGRKRTTLIFDLISWSVPCLIWAVAQDYRYFIAAAVVNSVWRVTENAWNCLLVEDTNPELLVDIWSWISIAGLLAAFFSPLTGVLIARFDLVPTIRGLFVFSFISMTAKFLATNAMVTETRQGLVRMQQTKEQPIFSVLRGTPSVVAQILRTRSTLFTAGLFLVPMISRMITRTFWSILVTEKLNLPPEYIAVYPFIRAIAMLVTYFYILPWINQADPQAPMLMGFTGLIISTTILVATPPSNYWMLFVSTILEAFSLPLVTTLLAKLIVINVDAQERARIMAVLNAVVLIAMSPFGWFAGRLSEINQRFPFVLSILLYAFGLLLTYMARRISRRTTQVNKTA